MKTCFKILMLVIAPISLFLLICSSNLNAQYPNMPSPNKILNIETGLPDEYITCIEQDAKGYIWIGTRTGLVRFDGSKYKTWVQSDSIASVASNWILSLNYEKETDILWIGTATGLNFMDLNTEIISAPANDTLSLFSIKKEWITGIHQDSHNQYWVYNIGLHLYDPILKTATPFISKYGEKANQITLVIQDKFDENILWLATMAGFVKFNSLSKKFEGLYNHNNLHGTFVNGMNSLELCLYQHDNGDIYGGSLNGGLMIFDYKTQKVSTFEPKWKNYKFSPLLQYKSIVRISKHLLCIGTNEGMIWYNPSLEKVVNFITTSKFQGKTITPYFKDKDDRIWISTMDGLEIFDPYFSQIQSLPFDTSIMPEKMIAIRLVENISENILYFIQNSGDGVYRFDLTTRRFLSPIKNQKDNFKTSINTSDILLNKNQDLLLLSKSNIFKLNEETWENLNIAPKLRKAPFISFLENKNNELILLSIYLGMYKLSYPDRKITHFDNDYFYDDGWWIKEGFYDSKGRLWINHLNIGFSIFDFENENHQIINLNNNNPLKIHRFKDQIWVNDSILLVCSGKAGIGLIHRDFPRDGVFKKYSPHKKGLITDKIYALAKDENDNIWMLGDIGLQKFHPKTDSFTFYAYPNKNLIIKSDVIDQTVFEKLSDGRMVFSYDNGLAFFDPNTLAQNDEDIHPLFSEISIMDEKVDANMFFEDDIKLKYNENFLSFNFSAIGFTASEKNTFEYKLNGIDKKWETISANQKVKYAHLPHGKYTLQLKAFNNDYISNEKIALLSFAILPPWWATWWAYTLYAIAAISAFVLWDMNRRKKWKLASEIVLQKEKLSTIEKQKELDLLNAVVKGEETERMRLSRELHDSVGAMLSSIKLYFQILKKENPNLKSDKTYTKTQGLISDTYTEVRNISHNLMPIDIFEIGLEKSIKNLCENFNVKDDLDIQCQFYIEDILVKDEIQLHLYRIIQEIIKNAVHHGDANNIFLQLTMDDEIIHLEIENDGKIFNVQDALLKKGIGLKNIISRVKYIQGELDIVSNQTVGTIFSIIISK